MRLKRPRIHDTPHLDFIRSLPCVSCDDNTSTEAAHLRAGNLEYGKRHTGMSEKPSDKWTLPLCSSCHRSQHEGDESLFWAVRGINPWVLAMTLHDISGDIELATEVLSRCKSRDTRIDGGERHMNERIYRVQDEEGRGPYKPGFSCVWTDSHHDQRNPSLFEDFKVTPDEFSRCWQPNENGGCAFRTLPQLNSWFGLHERFKLEELGYSIVTMLVDRILFESDRQLIFARKRPLRLGAIKLPWHAEEWVG